MLSLPNAADSGNAIGEIREGDKTNARSRNIHKAKALVLEKENRECRFHKENKFVNP